VVSNQQSFIDQAIDQWQKIVIMHVSKPKPQNICYNVSS